MSTKYLTDITCGSCWGLHWKLTEGCLKSWPSCVDGEHANLHVGRGKHTCSENCWALMPKDVRKISLLSDVCGHTYGWTVLKWLSWEFASPERPASIWVFVKPWNILASSCTPGNQQSRSVLELVTCFSPRTITPSCLPKARFLRFSDLAPRTNLVLSEQTCKL